jgi:methylmalonyl-CoA mutase N-terminal domain/subunit
MTNRIEQQARELIERLDAMGGALTAIETGYIQRQIQDSAYATQRAIDAGEAAVVGVNVYVDEAETRREIFQVDPDAERQQIDRVRAVRSSRSDGDWRRAIASIEAAARGGDNLVPPIIAAVEQRATLGEVADAMRRVFGEYRDVAGGA